MAAFVTPTTFLMSTNMAYVVGGARQFTLNEKRALRDPPCGPAVETMDERAGIVLLIGGQMAMTGPKNDKTTLQDGYGIKFIRSTTTIGNSVSAEFQLTAEDAAAVEAVEKFPGWSRHHSVAATRTWPT